MDRKKTYIPPETHILTVPGHSLPEIDGMSDEELQAETIRKAKTLYQIRPGYSLRSFCDENLVVPVAKETLSENQVAILSPVGRFLWDRLQSGQTFGDLLTALLAEYAVSRDEAEKDIEAFLSELDANQYLVKEN